MACIHMFSSLRVKPHHCVSSTSVAFFSHLRECLLWTEIKCHRCYPIGVICQYDCLSSKLGIITLLTFQDDTASLPCWGWLLSCNSLLT